MSDYVSNGQQEDWMNLVNWDDGLSLVDQSSQILVPASSTWLDLPVAYPFLWESFSVASPSMVWDDIPSTSPPTHLLPGRQEIAAIREDQRTAEPHPSDVREHGEVDTTSNAQYIGMGRSMAIDNPSSSVVAKGGRRPKKSVTNVKCGKPGCTFKGTFSRRAELERHVVQKHSGKGKFWCPAVGCFKGNGRTTFARADKLTDHIRQAHMRAVITEETAKNEALFSCPNEDCEFPPMTLDLLGVHLMGHGTAGNRHAPCNYPQHQSIYNAAVTRRTKCPLWTCGENLPLNKLQVHLLQHKFSELLVEEKTVQQQGYILVRPSCPLDDEGNEAGAESQMSSIAEVHLKCPVSQCSATARTHQDFFSHIKDAHVYSDNSHFDAYLDGLRKQSRSSVFDQWRIIHRAGSDPTVRCPACGILSDHHEQSLLYDPIELFPVRRQILKLCPAFASHPVFDDLQPSSN